VTGLADICRRHAAPPDAASALEVYADGLAQPPLTIHVRDGARFPLVLDRWLGAVDEVDCDVLLRCRGPVLDIGCGPGRHVHELASRGILALGVDISAAAVGLARDRGAPAVVASVFDRLPGAWRTALLLDGNIGIGGRPVALLRRVSQLLARDGELLVELAAPDVQVRVLDARLESPTRVSEWFAWAQLGADAIDAAALEAGLVVDERWERGGRFFARARRCGRLFARARRGGR
jgi:SAM-dependent methyltransferase